ncbi:paraquat-inducible protein A [Neptuniibacter halophilus]|uniref:paraquat-inducible protein A n=1 Tax=Neptuniibacter halophilus TaxID=651666 RepID=UPI002573C2C6|nr:paraquat-inducible protein A [Neptuniibacter halophilus]
MPDNLPLTVVQIRLLRTAIFATGVILLLGLVSPMLTMSQFYFFASSFSVLGGVQSLFVEGEYLLGVLIFMFSVALPVAKLWLLYRLTDQTQPAAQQRKWLHWMHEYGRWAMLDVMVVAVLIVTVKLGALVSVEVHWGLYIFALAVLLIMLLTRYLVKLSDG